MHSRIAINPDGGPSDPEPDPLIKKSNLVIHLTDYVLRNIVFFYLILFLLNMSKIPKKKTRLQILKEWVLLTQIKNLDEKCQTGVVLKDIALQRGL